VSAGGGALVGLVLFLTPTLLWGQPPEVGDSGKKGLTLTAEPESIPADGQHSSRIVATVESGTDTVLKGIVEFSTTAGRLINTTVALDEKSQAQTFLVSATEPATATVTACFGDRKARVRVIFECSEGGVTAQQMFGAPAVWLSAHWHPVAGQPGYNCVGGGATLSGGPVELIFNATWQNFPIIWVGVNSMQLAENAGHPAQFYDLGYSGRPPGYCGQCSPPPPGQGTQSMIVAASPPPHPLHNSEYTLTVGYTYQVAPMPFQYVTDQIQMVVSFDNLVVTAASQQPVLLWNPAEPDPNPRTVNYTLAVLQQETVQTHLTVYDLAGNEVRSETFFGLEAPSAQLWTWAGTNGMGQPVPKGVYPYVVGAMSNLPGTQDQDKSSHLALLPGEDQGQPVTEAEYLGFDAQAETQDFLIRYGLQCQSVRTDNDGDGRWDEDPVDGQDNDGDQLVDEDPQEPADATQGELVVFDPDLETWSADLNTLECQQKGHAAHDGLHATLGGVQHAVRLKVPTALMGKTGNYHFVVRARDAHGHLERSHQNKWARECGQTLDVRVRSVKWDTFPGNVPLDDNPGNGTNGTDTGQRIFPGKAAPNDLQPEDRRRAQVIAELAPPLEHFPVKLCSYDVDDPSSNTDPVDDEETQWPQTENDDNRSHPNSGIPTRGRFVDTGTPNTEADTDNQGKATATFEVTMQPGDNFRVVATGKDNDLAPVAPKPDDRDAQNAPQARVFLREMEGGQVVGEGEPVLDDETTLATVKVTPVLTVWRKLHVEVDSMGTVAGNVIRGELGVVEQVEGHPELSECTIHQLLARFEDNRFKGGILQAGGQDFSVVANDCGSDPFHVTVENAPGNVAPGEGDEFTLVDDDHWQDLSLDPQENPDTPMPDTPELAAAMAEAYVLIHPDDIVQDNTLVPFSRNVSEPDLEQTDWDTEEHNATNYWVAYLLGSFQGTRKEDCDPNEEGDPGAGVELGRTGSQQGADGPVVVGESFIYLETIWDLAHYDGGYTAHAKELDTVVHEVGHAVAQSMVEPPTAWPGRPARYTEEYVDLIRDTPRPASH